MSDIRTRTSRATRGLAMFGAGALALHGWRLVQTVGGAPTRYHVDRRSLPPCASDEFRDYVSTITDSEVYGTRVSRLRNGEEFYAAELDAIRGATASINLEAYGFLPGRVADEVVRALADRARAGVEVRMVLDAIGSWRTSAGRFDALRRAGGRVAWYHGVNLRDWPYLNNRTHRKLLVVDGSTGFIGGAGFADHWLGPTAHGRQWRDTVLQVEGGAVAALNGAFAENWLETTGEILAGSRQFRFPERGFPVPALVVTSTPRGGTSRARMLFQTLIEAARTSIHITTPYFVPDRSARHALMRASDRGVAVRILTAGPHSDHPMTRQVSRMFAGSIGRAGADVYEYQPAMIHAKLMTVDGLWTVAGSSNFDHRSFDLNDEVNLVTVDRDLAAQIDADFERDLGDSRRLTTRRLASVGLFDRILQDGSWLLRREQ